MEFTIALAGFVAVVLGAALVWALVRSRGQRQRLVALIGRLEDESTLADVEGDRSLERIMSRLERAVEDAAARADDIESRSVRLVEVAAQVDDGIVVADEHGTIAYANPAARRFLDAQHTYAVVDRQIREDIELALRLGESHSRELDLVGPPRRLIALHVRPLDDGRRTIGASAYIVDRTRERRVDAVRRDFVANISHELKTPVAALGLLTETLADSLDDPAVVSRMVSRLTGEADRLVTIIDDLIELSRIEAQEAPEREPVSLDSVVDGAVDRVRSDFSEREPDVVTEVSVSAVVIGDRRQLASAVYNLLQNAIRYSEPGSAVRVSGSVDGALVRLAISDAGIGIPEHERDRIFERFYRVDRARARATGGTGLGLAIVRHVVNSHGGTIVVESEVGVGSTFTISLPLVADQFPQMQPRLELVEPVAREEAAS